MAVVGIDLGTTSSSVSIFRNGSVELLEVEETYKVMPSCVAFNGTERLVGQRALAQLVDNPKNTIRDVKAMIGLTYDEAQKLRNWGFELENVSSKPKILVQCGVEQKGFYPEEITSMILSKIWKNTKKILGKEPKGAVITVPASFNHAQRKATIDAAKIAGVPVLELINEPTAAALAYQYQNTTNTRTEMLILHFGGGSFNVSVMTCNKGNLKVRASIGSSQFGGINLDDQLFKNVTEIGEKICDAMINRVSACKLRLACETAKKNLSATARVRVEVKALLDGEDFHETIDRKKFQTINKHIFEAIKNSVIRVLRQADVDVSKINDVLTIGNSTRLPFIEEILTKQCGFDHSQIRKTIKPDEVAVSGAAIRATMLAENQNAHESRMRSIQDILPNDIYANGSNGRLLVFSRGVSVPSEVEIPFPEEIDHFEIKFYRYGPAIVDRTFEWKDRRRSLSEITISCDKSKVDQFTANINSSGIFEITVSPESGSFTRYEKCGLCPDEIEQLIKDRESQCIEDEDRTVRDKELYELESEAYKTKDNDGCDLSWLFEWIRNTMDPTLADIRAKREELKNLKDPSFDEKKQKELEDRELQRTKDENRTMRDNELYSLKREAYKTKENYGSDLSWIFEWIRNTLDPSLDEIREKREELEQEKLKQSGKKEPPLQSKGPKEPKEKDRELQRIEDENRTMRDNELCALKREAYKTKENYGSDLSGIFEWIRNTLDPSLDEIREKRKELEEEKTKQIGKTEPPLPKKKLKVDVEKLLSLFQALRILEPYSEEQISSKAQSQIEDSHIKSVGNQPAQKLKNISQSDVNILFDEAHAEIKRLQTHDAHGKSVDDQQPQSVSQSNLRILLNNALAEIKKQRDENATLRSKLKRIEEIIGEETQERFEEK